MCVYIYKCNMMFITYMTHTQKHMRRSMPLCFCWVYLRLKKDSQGRFLRRDMRHEIPGPWATVGHAGTYLASFSKREKNWSEYVRVLPQILRTCCYQVTLRLQPSAGNFTWLGGLNVHFIETRTSERCVRSSMHRHICEHWQSDAQGLSCPVQRSSTPLLVV